MLDIIDTTTNKIHVMDDGTTVDDILFALKFLRNERKRCNERNKKRYIPTGNKRGRPRKESVDPKETSGSE